MLAGGLPAGHDLAGSWWSPSWPMVEGHCSNLLTEAQTMGVPESLLGCGAAVTRGSLAPSGPTQGHIAAVMGDEGRKVESKNWWWCYSLWVCQEVQCHTCGTGGSRR